MIDKNERHTLRAFYRTARKRLSEEEQAAAAAVLSSLVTAQDFYQSATKIAFYLAVDGEIDPQPLLSQALIQGKTCFLPVVKQRDEQLLSFAPYDSATGLVENQWGIAEPPAPATEISPTGFDLVLVPLVAFDRECYRLGMGKGFYDRTFSFKIFDRSSQPLLIGLAHECQLADGLPNEGWDVRLDAVVTAEKIYRPDTA
ncbi:MAG: 5-formyltetrahydrofolate cyclo-ligase [Pseudomonadota bacterium]|nr:5-formyltetrahydrofolate cyclo-ligase [Pseudomonadota bacterium]MEC8356769.1 5-formyltetrahydrofolate cyclo-ligase [Pseudomonadota bacterium]